MKTISKINKLITGLNAALGNGYERFVGHWMLALIFVAFAMYGELGLIFALLLSTIIVAMRINFQLYWKTENTKG